MTPTGIVFSHGGTQASPPRQDQFHVVGPDGPLVVGAGEDVILPCSLKPNISAVDMTVEWFRLHTSDLLLHFYEGGVESKDQIQSYRGRTSLFKEELQKGNASLKLSRAKTTDEGEYRCVVQSKDWIDDISFKISVSAVGTYPVISIEGYRKDGGLSLLCEIKSWNPEPEVLWLDSDGNLLPAEDTETLRDTERFHVKKHVTVQDTNINRFYCRVILTDHMKESEIVISKKERHIDEVNVTLDPDTAHPNLILSDDRKQVQLGDTKQVLSNNPERFDYCFGVLGKEGFSSGKFYYEVQVSGKTEWDLGVVKESVNRKKCITLCPKHGFWTVWLWKGKVYRGIDGHSALSQTLQTVGVFVDYEEGVVSFYDVEARSHICSFTGQTFTEKLYPFFSPYSSDKGKKSAPLIITIVNHNK
ncbi:butyrophilin subfamily 1 member A1-like [Chanos chanos]|uniref:Butyrophilin subfamily 1 member A1-like n=1 Tax=Chanos chanos TaxID=29144 RepID=A0A6J2VT75_CHACN|nr:butyrophilin subfamily 1 member A1-like [Chanos chanos]